LLLAQNEKENATWQLAAGRGHFELLEKICNCKRIEEINRSDLKNKFLLANTRMDKPRGTEQRDQSVWTHYSYTGVWLKKRNYAQIN